MRVELGAFDLNGYVRGLMGGFLVAALLLSGAVFAVSESAPVTGETASAMPTAEEIALEARVKAFSYDLRCLVCQNETIADSRAPLALDLRQQVKEQFLAGKSEAEVRDFMVARYGDFVLYSPPIKGVTLLLWFGPALLLLAGGGWLAYRLRTRQHEHVMQLSDEEHERARALLAGHSSNSEESRT